MAMSPDIPDLVETSTNLATLKMDEKKIVVGTSQRSSIESAKNNIANMVDAVFKLGGAKLQLVMDILDGSRIWIQIC